MSMLAKGVTIGALVSASLAIPIVATVNYFQNKPDRIVLPPVESPSSPPAEPLAATILELEPLIIEASPAKARPVARASERPSTRDPARFELELPRVDRSPLLDSRRASSPSVDSKGMPPPLARAEKRTLLYEEHFR